MKFLTDLDRESYLSSFILWGFWQFIMCIPTLFLFTACVAFVQNSIEPFVELIEWFTFYGGGLRVIILVYAIIWFLGSLGRMLVIRDDEI